MCPMILGILSIQYTPTLNCFYVQSTLIGSIYGFYCKGRVQSQKFDKNKLLHQFQFLCVFSLVTRRNLDFRETSFNQ